MNNKWLENEIKAFKECGYRADDKFLEIAVDLYKEFIAKTENNYVTKILTSSVFYRLIYDLPLTEITEKDIVGGKCDRYEDLTIADGVYSDKSRIMCYDIDDIRTPFANDAITKIFDKVVPIEMPYFPQSADLKVVVKTEGNNITCVLFYLYDNKRIEVNKTIDELRREYLC